MNPPDATEPTLTVAEIIAQFSLVPKSGLPKAALAAAVARREEIRLELLPRCLIAIERGEACPEEEFWLLTYGLMLMAEFKEPLTMPLLLRILRMPADDREMLISDSVTEDMPRWLAAVQNGDLAPIKALIEDREVDGMARWCALRSLVVLVGTGERTREEIIGYLRELCGKLEREESDVWLGVVDCAMNLHPGPLLKELRAAYADGLVDESVIPEQAVLEEAERGLDALLAALPKKERPFTTAAAELARWECFKPGYNWDDEPPPFDADFLADDLPEPDRPGYDYDLPPMPYVAPAKIGRNDPCPCGSGKKFKKCCLDKA